ncbi:VC0807 family protein [Nonomuraea sp. NPDC048892]|uniref:VC0807 family protein n=1 Tax=Nonomuraea sp. NPDC048892 TaxID=3154624 RepID=UPI0034093BBC
MDKRKLIVGLLWDAGLPTAVFYLCRALGLDPMPALIAGGLAALARVGYVAVVRRRLNGLSALMAATFLLLLVVSALTGDPRVLLAKESILTGAAGLLLVGSCALGRPVLFALVRRLGAGGDEAPGRWEERWRTEPALRRQFYLLSLVTGSGLLLDAVVRVVLVYLLPIDTMAGLSTALHVTTLVLLGGWVTWYRRRRVQAAHPVAGHPVTATGSEHTHAR